MKFLKAFAKLALLPALRPADGPERISTGTPTGAYSPGVKQDELLFVSGRAPRTRSAEKLVRGTIEEETLLTLENIRRIVEAAGGTVRDIVKCTAHLSDMNDFDRYNKAYASFFGGVFPARTTVQSVLGDGLKVEIDAVAVIKK
ncbi:RidA family protein [Puia sp. P3]|uniref:RidA family protein n=1 Tax=Puia sp. P3 TaxID=3423952 RepID=UPI003D6753F7